MKQQIDLYRQFAPPAKGLSGATAAALAVLAAVAFVALIYFLAVRETWHLQDQIRQLEGRRGQLAEALRQVRETAGPLPSSAALDKEIAAAEKRVAEQDLLVARTARLRQRRTQGFSGYLLPLARNKTRGLWLKRLAVTVAAEGDRLLVAGTALQPELIPRFIREMAVHDNFFALNTAVLKMERVAGDGQRVDFLLETGGSQKP